ncbi:MAG: hypothetical protein Q8K00_19515 [Syntrophales bacterium]|nr:hypothetical protein [Syntrophales bacterium]
MLEGGEKGYGCRRAEDGRVADVSLPEQGLFMKEVMAELDHERRNGKKSQPLDQNPGGVMEEMVEEDAPLVKGDGQAEGGEGKMERLPLLCNHQSRGHGDADRHQHEDFHCSLAFLRDSFCLKQIELLQIIISMLYCNIMREVKKRGRHCVAYFAL